MAGTGEKAIDPVEAESIKTLYGHVPGTFLAVPIVAISLIVMAWSYADHKLIGLWTAAVAATQAWRLAIYFSYRRRQPQGDALKLWALHYIVYMLVIGLLWGAAAFVFLEPGVPMAVILTFCAMYSLGAGSIAVNAYHQPSYYAFVTGMFLTALGLTVLTGEFNLVVLGMGAGSFAVMTLLFVRIQSRVMRESIAIRFENIRILAEMKEAREKAEIARRQAELANLSKSRFLAAASHDLRQPLHALSLFSGALDAFKLGREEKAVVGHIQDNIAAMEGLFNGLLDLSRLEAGAVQQVIRPFPLQPLFDRLERYFLPLASEKGLSIRLSPTRVWVNGDEILTEQILMNLIANGLRYAEEGGVVAGVRRSRDRIRLEVVDTGQGIAPADRERIFDAFVQIGNAERDRRKGLGLGLSIAARTASLLGTRIAVDSIVGKGSRFAFEVPVAAPLVASAVKTAGISGSDPVSHLRLLIIDDDQAVREALDLLLRGWHCDFVIVDSLEAAIEVLEAGPQFDVIISDHRLREGGVGLDFLIGLETRNTRLPGRALVTGDVDPDLMQRVKAAGIFMLHKPVDPARLRAMLSHLAVMERQ